ncbi:MAG: ABC transporter permease [Erythrobacter sp.]|nr:ABC transporter permease [Erythrobacter sp.]MDZ4273086.1 ABC transporter permease [Erythrobacter sp.]MDZ4276299.1 ABC transporter permease [Erythrobacter sp.]
MNAGVAQAMRRHRGAAVGAALLAMMALAAIAAPLIAPIDPQLISPFDRLQDPDARYWFGTDQIGRDVFSRTVYGARVSMMVGCVVALTAIFSGLVLGLLAGFIRWIDGILMRVMDGLMAIPSILLAIALVAISGPSIRSIVIAITIAEVPRVTRLVRGQVIALRGQLFIEAATTAGTSVPVILYRHIVPNLLAPLLVQASYVFAAAVMTEAVLSFIGAGVPPETPSWGNIISEGRTVFQLAPHIVLFPSLVLSVMVLSVNILGDGLRDAFDPRFTGQQ